MIRLTLIMLCLILAAAAAGRYKAEVAVRDVRSEIVQIDHKKAAEANKIQVLRAEIAYLESPERLAEIAERVTNLKPLSGAQLMTADDYLLAFGDVNDDGVPGQETEPAQAVTIADLGLAPAR
ncbi:MAG: hypothetical protein KDA46_14550 [Parvularculaceae bacterium]|nr:hypothetical protein [Parvularculaceae bacterium]